MKRNVKLGVILIIAYFIGYNIVYSQIQKPDERFYEDVSVFIDAINNMNPQIDGLKTQIITYDKYPNSDPMLVIILFDKDGYFLDLVHGVTYQESKFKLEPYSNVDSKGKPKFYHDTKRKISRVKGNYRDIYKLEFDDGSWIDLHFYKTSTSGIKWKLYLRDAKTEEMYKFSWCVMI